MSQQDHLQALCDGSGKLGISREHGRLGPGSPSVRGRLRRDGVITVPDAVAP